MCSKRAYSSSWDWKLYFHIIFYWFLTFIIIHNAVVAAYKSLINDKVFDSFFSAVTTFHINDFWDGDVI